MRRVETGGNSIDVFRLCHPVHTISPTDVCRCDTRQRCFWRGTAELAGRTAELRDDVWKQVVLERVDVCITERSLRRVSS